MASRSSYEGRIMIKILLAVDGSEPSIRATRSVVETVRLYREPVEVELVTVHLPVPQIGSTIGTVVTRQMVEQYYQEEGAQALAPSEKILKDAGIAYTSRILVGDIAQQIVEHGDAAQCRMIYMGTRGMSALPNLVMGSIATKVVHLALVPVVLVH
jgi:nucleotide-binding universal stress UspA family protein